MLVVTPSVGLARIEYVQSLANMLLHFAQYAVFEEDTEQGIDFYAVQGSGVSSNREHLARYFLAGDWTHLLWVDEDMTWSKECLHDLLRLKLPVVGCNYRMRRPNGDFMAVGEGEIGRIATTPETKGVEECVYAGFGFLLMERKLLQDIADASPEEGGMFPLGRMSSENRYATEDFGNLMIARSLGYKFHICHDTSKKIAHVGSFVYSWKDIWS